MPEELDVVFEAALQKALNFLSERGFNRELRQEQKSSVKQLFTGGLFMTDDDRIKCRYAHSGMTSGVGGFQNSGVCLQAFPPFLPPLPPPPRLLAPFFARSLLRNSTETLASQACANRTENDSNPTFCVYGSEPLVGMI